VNENVIIMGAAGASGQRIARALAARGVPLTLAGRHRATLAPLADELGAAVTEADITRPAPVLDQARLVVNTVGPFGELAPALAAASLAAGVAYVDIANELTATTRLLELDGQAKASGTVLVTGAGFGPAVTESMLLRLLPTLPGPAARVRVAGAPSAPGGPVSPGIQATAAQAAAEGTAWYAGGELTRAPLGTGGTLMTLGPAGRGT
jgi:saccharopine dehydrogenase (NAD+, L-lysine-forming)